MTLRRDRLPDLAVLAPRLLGQGGRLLFLFYAARLLTLEEVATYGLFQSSLLFAVQMIGLEFHMYAGRAVISASTANRRDVLIHHLLIAAVGWLVGFPLLAALFRASSLPWSLFALFSACVAGSHLAQEAFRALVALSQPAQGHRISLVASALWVFPAIGLGVIGPQWRTLEVALVLWAVFSAAAALIGWLAAFRHCEKRSPFRLDGAFLRAGLRSSLFFFVAAVALRALDVADRYALDHWHGTAAVASYVVYASFARVLHEVVLTGYATSLYPSLVKAVIAADAVQQAEVEAQLSRRLRLGTLSWAIPLAVFGVFAPWILGRDELAAARPWFALLLASSVLLNASLPAHYRLYAAGAERTLAKIHVAVAAIDLVLLVALVPRFGIAGAAAALVASTFALVLFKRRAASRLTSAAGRPPGAAA